MRTCTSDLGELTEAEEIFETQSEPPFIMRDHFPRPSLRLMALKDDPRRGIHAEDESDGSASRLSRWRLDETGWSLAERVEEREDVLGWRALWGFCAAVSDTSRQQGNRHRKVQRGRS
jgi:hypothetical protein